MWTDYQIETTGGEKISIERDEIDGEDNPKYRVHFEVNGAKWNSIVLDESELRHFMKLCQRSLNNS